jgi:hypothetical protein
LHMLAPVCTAHTRVCTCLPSKNACVRAQRGQHACPRTRVCFLATWRRGKAHIMRAVPAEGRAGRRTEPHGRRGPAARRKQRGPEGRGRREAAITRARGSMRLSGAPTIARSRTQQTCCALLSPQHRHTDTLRTAVTTRAHRHRSHSTHLAAASAATSSQPAEVRIVVGRTRTAYTGTVQSLNAYVLI